MSNLANQSCAVLKLRGMMSVDQVTTEVLAALGLPSG